jgi:addiction module HigA family antidote
VSEIVNGKRGVTPLTAMRFAKALHNTPNFWLNIQYTCDLYNAHQSPEAMLVEKIQPLSEAA